MGIFDLLIGVTYGFFIFLLGLFWANFKFKHNSDLRRTFLYSITLRIISAILFGCLFAFYYGSGDCTLYFRTGLEYKKYIWDHPSSFWDFLFLNEEILKTNYQDYLSSTLTVPEYFLNSNIMVHRFILLLGPFALFEFFPLCILFSLISFVGCWIISRSLSQIYPSYTKFIKVSFLFLPSVVFWTAGIGKDALCLGFVNLLAFGLIQLIIHKKKSISMLTLIFISCYMVFVIKSYIILSFLPFFSLFLFSQRIKNINSSAKRIVLKSFAIVFLGLSVFLIGGFTDFFQKMSKDTIENALYLTRGQQAEEVGNDSKYDLGITLSDIESKNISPFILPSILVAFFRPYPWEVKKIIMVFSFLESFIFLILTVYAFWKGYIFRTVRIILNDHFLLFCFLYSIFFAFFVGLVSSNFGTLIRYKTPFTSYFLLGLLILIDKLKNKNVSNV